MHGIELTWLYRRLDTNEDHLDEQGLCKGCPHGFVEEADALMGSLLEHLVLQDHKELTLDDASKIFECEFVHSPVLGHEGPLHSHQDVDTTQQGQTNETALLPLATHKGVLLLIREPLEGVLPVELLHVLVGLSLLISVCCKGSFHSCN